MVNINTLSYLIFFTEPGESYAAAALRIFRAANNYCTLESDGRLEKHHLAFVAHAMPIAIYSNLIKVLASFEEENIKEYEPGQLIRLVWDRFHADIEKNTLDEDFGAMNYLSIPEDLVKSDVVSILDREVKYLTVLLDSKND